MNATSVLVSSIYNLFEIFFETLSSADYAIITDEILGSAKTNVIEHVTALLSTQNNQSIAETINYTSEIMNFPPSVATAVEDCTLAAFTNLTNIENIASMDPVEYVMSTRNATEYCLFEKGAVREVWEDREPEDEEADDWADGWQPFVHLLWLSWGSTAVLFGPWCRVLFPRDRLLFAGID